MMNKLKSWRNLALILLAIFGLSFSIFLTQPSNATQANYERMIQLGLIDEVKTPEELGLDYLHRRPPQLTADLVDSIRQVRDDAETQWTDDIRVAIPLGENDPFPVGALPGDDDYEGINVSSFEETGYVDSSGQALPVTGGDVVDMFTQEANNGGSFDALKTREILVADASGSFLQARRVSVIDLIARNRRDGKYYLLPNVRVDSFCRDALNAVSNRTWRRNDVDVRRLNLRRL